MNPSPNLRYIFKPKNEPLKSIYEDDVKRNGNLSLNKSSRFYFEIPHSVAIAQGGIKVIEAILRKKAIKLLLGVTAVNNNHIKQGVIITSDLMDKIIKK